MPVKLYFQKYKKWSLHHRYIIPIWKLIYPLEKKGRYRPIERPHEVDKLENIM